MTLTDAPAEFKLENPPTDLISAIKFSPNSSQFLLASSWDTSVRLYDVTKNCMRSMYIHESAVLDCCFQDAVHCWSGGLDYEVKMCDLNSNTKIQIGRHEAAVRCVEYCSDINAIITGSWDSTIKIWDSRACACQGTFSQPDKVYTMAVSDSKLIVGTSGRRVLVWDLRNMGHVEQRRESSLKYQTRCIRCFPNGQGYVLSSIEGRVAIEYLDPHPEIQKKKYAFKCHRVKGSNGTEYIYPVNAIAFHMGYNTFATGGSDGFVNIWDGFNKKRLCQLHQYPTQISALSFAPDGNSIAIASSFIYEIDEEEQKKDADNIFIKTVTDHETKPK